MAEERLKGEKIIGNVSFFVIVGLFIFVSNRAGIRATGVSLLVTSAYQLQSDGIPYGWEGREPSGYIRGIWKLVCCALLAALGIALLAAPDVVLSIIE